MSLRSNERAKRREKLSNLYNPLSLRERIANGTADPISESERIRAARIRVACDKKLDRETPDFILKLSEGHLASSSVLQERIDTGLADPISAHEREIVKRIREDFVKRFGREPGEEAKTVSDAGAWKSFWSKFTAKL